MTTGPGASADPPLSDRIKATEGQTDAVHAVLRTDGRVLARVTDGIYRLPGASIRELISNAYDADATRVTIRTDRPRFNRIVVEDDGHGMDADALAHMLEHIGGSAKRSSKGLDLGVTGTNANMSPNGRRLIGKIGIGLFSVSQLTQQFQIITKVKGESKRTVASIVLKQFTDDAVEDAEAQLESGLVTTWQEPALQDRDTHGTTVILNKIRPRTRQLLQGSALWQRVIEEDADPPKYHIGSFDSTNDEVGTLPRTSERLPWPTNSDPLRRFQSMVDSVWSEVDLGHTNPKLENLFDNYLRMLWQLGLSAPVRYVDDEPVAEAFDGDVLELSPRGAAIATVAPEDLAEKLKFIDKDPAGKEPFRVFFDDVELRRPVRFKDLPTTTNRVRRPMLFRGHLREDFPGIPEEVSGGPLEFTAYLMWAPKIAPVESVGSLIRVHGASGTGYDETFMRYQVAEITRLRQITCEIFVTRGLEAALNIDRESVNQSHPHAVRLTSWLHAALKSSIAYQKRVANQLREQSRTEASDAQQAALGAVVERLWEEVTDDPQAVPKVAFSDSASVRADLKFPRTRIFGDNFTARSKVEQTTERQLTAITQILAAYGLLDDLAQEESERLIAHLAEILRVTE